MQKNIEENFQHQWQYKLIQKIESVSDSLRVPQKKKMCNVLLGLILGILLIFGMFFVPTNILANNSNAVNLVEFTASIFPWIDMTKVNYGSVADKFVFWQCVSVWLLIIPYLVGSLAYAKLRINKRLKGNEYYKLELIAFPAIIIVFIIAIIIPNLYHSSTYMPWQQALFVFNEYFCAAGAVMLGLMFDMVMIRMIITIIYLIHFIRNLSSYYIN